jgi:FKBP-type peptidyl-prolyl cis-trans isomerase
MRFLSIVAVATTFFVDSEAFSLSMVSEKQATSSRRGFFFNAASTAGLVASIASVQPVERAEAVTAPAVYKLDSGVKYATLKEGKGSYPQQGDIIAIEYTGYLTTGTIFDGTHSEGKQNALLFKLGR